MLKPEIAFIAEIHKYLHYQQGSSCWSEEIINDWLQVVLRRLPPNLSKDQLEEQLSPLPSFDYFEFFPADQR